MAYLKGALVPASHADGVWREESRVPLSCKVVTRGFHEVQVGCFEVLNECC